MRRFIVFMALVLFTVAFVSAQEPQEEIWNWARRDATGELFAYSSSGVVNTLLSSGTEEVFAAWRLSNDRAIAVIQINAETTLYDLTSQSTEPYTFNFDVQSLEVPFDVRYSYALKDYSSPYMVFTPAVQQASPPFDPALLVNVETREVELLSNDVRLGAYVGCCRFTEDGKYLRYVVGSGDYDAQTLMLRERVLTTGAEHDLFTLTGEGGSMILYPDLYGERWLFYEQPVDSGLRSYRILLADGTNEQIYQQLPTETHSVYEFLGDDLIAHQALCTGNCELQLWTIDADEFTFRLPFTQIDTSIYPIQRFDEHLVIERLYDYWLLSTTDDPLFLGYNFPAGSHGPSELSPDRRWLLVADTETYPASVGRIWDLTTPEVVVEFAVGSEAAEYSMIYDVSGFIAYSLDTGAGIMYRFEDQTIFNLPDQGYGSYFDIIPNGTVLYQSNRSTELEAGIYLYSPNDNSFSLLISDVWAVSIEDANYYAYPR